MRSSGVWQHDVKLVPRAFRAPSRRVSRQCSLITKVALTSPPSQRQLERFPLTATFAGYEFRQRCAFCTTSGKHNAGDAAPVDAPTPPMAIVFTDIVKSTALWEKDSSAMTEAMDIHDDLIRRLCAVHKGYEVKQNGDGFMIAFQSTVDTLRFCLDVQVELQEQRWPAHLLELGPGKPIIDTADADSKRNESSGDRVLWKGLRLRISIHFGAPVCKWNEVTERMDYLGPVVNRAARFIGVCEGGQIVVSEEYLHELSRIQTAEDGADDSTSSNASRLATADTSVEGSELKAYTGCVQREYEVQLLGDRHLAGVSEDQRLYFIVPKSLIGRLEYFPKNRYVRASKGNLTENG